jgi:dolichyl-diphosphooligosaccharide--protein glycosyltransferase
VPYSTTGYDDYGPSNGYTNVSVRATGPYRLSTPTQFGNESATLYNASVDVDESLVVGDGESSLDVTMEQQTIEFPDGNTTDGNTTEDNQTTNDTSGGAAAVGGSADSGPSDAVTATDVGTGGGDALAAAPARQTSVLLG